ncbi:MAG TPA: winged helix DNA-binding domain-containing protein [Solirubrobacterales bacterium]|nr:winged helix DNA-binding domain-containing protein [Solirubrobacterales bacterium]
MAERLLAIQGQDARGARLAVRARSEGLVASDVDRALDERRLIITWVNRGTLHLIRAEDYPLLQALTTPPLWTSCRTRLRQTEVGDRADRGVEAVARALEDGPRTRAELRDALDSADVPTAGQALIHILFYASLKGVCIRGPMIGKEHAFVSARDWLAPVMGPGWDPERTSPQFVSEGSHPGPSRDTSLGELARRYLVGHGPATDADLARWAGLPLRDARAGLAAISRRTVDLGDGVVELRRREETAPLPEPRLLGAFDPLLLGWVSRDNVIGPHKGLVTTNGIFRPFALVKGRAVATWRFQQGKVQIEHLERVTKKAAARLDADAAAVEAFLSN